MCVVFRRVLLGFLEMRALISAKEAPVFLTAQISQKGSRKRPGNTDPRVNEAITDELNKRIHQDVGTKLSKQKLMVLVNSLIETKEKMRIGGEQVRIATYCCDQALISLVLVGYSTRDTNNSAKCEL